jgi:hypothetical protein
VITSDLVKKNPRRARARLGFAVDVAGADA